MEQNALTLCNYAIDELHLYLAERFAGYRPGIERLTDIKKSFIAAYILYSEWNEEHGYPLRNLLIRYAFVCALLQDGLSGIAYFFDQEWVRENRGSQLQRDMAASPSYVLAYEEELSGVDFLTIYAALTKNMHVTYYEGSEQIPGPLKKITPDECALRYIHAACREDSPLVDCLGGFLWDGITMQMIRERPLLYWKSLSQSMRFREKRDKLCEIIYHFASGPMNEFVFRYFALAYEHYKEIEADLHKDDPLIEVLQEKWPLIKSYQLYGAPEKLLPESLLYEDMLQKVHFSAPEIARLVSLSHEDGFYKHILNNMYNLDYHATANGRVAIVFEFESFSHPIVSEYYQINTGTKNYFWLPEKPKKIVYAHLRSNTFCEAALLKKYGKKEGEDAPFSGMLFSELNALGKEIYLYSYAVDIAGKGKNAKLMQDTLLQSRFCAEYQRLPSGVAAKAAMQMLASSTASRETQRALIDQLLYTAPEMHGRLIKEFLALLDARQILTLLQKLQLQAGQMPDALGEKSFPVIAEELFAEDSRDFSFSAPFATALEASFIKTREAGEHSLLYLAYSWLYFGFTTKYTEEAIELLLRKGLRFFASEQRKATLRALLYVYLRQKSRRFSIDEDFIKALQRLWDLSEEDTAETLRFQAFLSRTVAQSDGPEMLKLSPYVEKLEEKQLPRHAMLYEFLLYSRIKEARAISNTEKRTLHTLYLKQRLLSARTMFMLEACFPEDMELFLMSLGHAWIRLPKNAKIEKVTPSATPKRAESAASLEEGLLQVVSTGYVYAFDVLYTIDGQEHKLSLKRAFSGWQIRQLFLAAGKAARNNERQDALVLMAGRICLLEKIFNPAAFLGYVAYLASQPSLQEELQTALLYAWSHDSEIAKYYMQKPEEKTYKLLLYVFTLFMDNAAFLEHRIPISRFFSYVYFLDRIAKHSSTKAFSHALVRYADKDAQMPQHIKDQLHYLMDQREMVLETHI